jgi:hypothetical protein
MTTVTQPTDKLSIRNLAFGLGFIVALTLAGVSGLASRQDVGAMVPREDKALVRV